MRLHKVIAKFVVASTLAPLVLTACDSGAPPAERDLVCNIVSPSPDAELTYAVDLVPSTPEYDLNVEVSVKDNNGEAIELESVRLQTKLGSQAEFVDGPVATLQSGKVSFANTVLSPGVNSIRFEAKAKGLSIQCSQTIQVNVGVVDETAPAVLTTAFEGDVNGDKILNRAELPQAPNTAVLKATTQNIENGQPLVVKDAQSGFVYGSGTVNNDAAQVTLSQLPASPEASYQLVLEVTTASGQKNQISNPSGPNYNAAAFTSLRIDTVEPTVTFTCPSKALFGLKDDDNKTADQFQLKVCNLVSNDTQKVKIQLGTAEEVICGNSCIEAGSSVVVLNVPTPGTTTQTLKATAVDTAGNASSVEMEVTLDFDPPTIAITQPTQADSPLLFWRNTVKADVVGADGQNALLFHLSSGSTTEVALDSKAVVSGKVTWEATFPANDTYTLVARVSDAAGNEATPFNLSGMVVNGAGCSVTITSPSTRPGYLTPKDDTDGATPGIQSALTAVSTNCNNTDVTLTVNGSNAQTLKTNGSGSVQFPLSFAASGTYSLSVAIDNGAPQPDTVDTMSLLVDVVRPQFGVPTPNQILNATDDSQRQTAGVQSLMTYTATVPTGGRVDICSNQSPAPSGATPCPDGQIGWWVLQSNVAASELAFSYPDGDYNIKPVIVLPLVGFNAGDERSVRVDSIRPTVVQPAVFENDLAPLGLLNISELAGGVPKIQVATSEEVTISVRTRGGGTVYTTSSTATAANAAVVSLDQNMTAAEEDYQLELVLTDSHGNTNIVSLADVSANDPLDTNAWVDVRVDKVVPTCSLTAPNKVLLGLADDAESLTSGFQLRVTGTTAADVGGGGVVLELTEAGGAVLTQPLTPSSSLMAYDFTLADSGTAAFSLKVTCSDNSGNQQNVTQTFTVDRDRPTVVLTQPTALDSPLLFWRNTFKADVTGADGQSATLYRVGSGSSTEVALDTQNVASGKVTWEGTFPANDTYSLIARVSDAAGNEATPAILSGMVVNGAGCSITISTPSTRPTYWTPKNDTDSGTAGIQATLTATSSNCNGTNVTVTIDGGSSQTLATDNSGVVNFPLSFAASGTYTVQVAIDNGSPQPATTDSMSMIVDVARPTIGVPAQNQVLLTTADFRRDLAGVQRQLTYTATIPAGGRVDICTNLSPAPGGSTACPDGQAGWWVLQVDVPSSVADFTFPDGVYSIKPVIVLPSGGFNDGTARSLKVDGIRPTVVQAVTFASDSVPLAKLNIAELLASGGAPVMQIVTNEEAFISVRAKGGGTSFTSTSTATSSNSATVTLNQNITGTEQDYELEVVLTDANGNTNVLSGATANDPLDSNAFVNFRVDKQAPTCSITTPSKSQLGVADDALSLISGYQMAVAVSTSADVGTSGVALNLTGGASPVTATVNAVGAAASHQLTISDSGTLTYDLAATCTDASGNSTAATTKSGLVVDNDVPTCELVAPSVAGGPYGVYSLATLVNVGGTQVNNLNAKIYSKIGSSPESLVGALTVTGTSASGTLTYPAGIQDLRAEVTDLAGNTCSNAERLQAGVDVSGTGCSLTVSSPLSGAKINQSGDINPATATVADITVTGNSSNCKTGQTVQVFAQGNPTPLGSSTVDASGDFSISISLAEATHTLDVTISNGEGVDTTKSLTNVLVDLSAPTYSSVTPTGANLYFVASANNDFVRQGNTAYVADTLAGGDANFSVQANGVTGAIGGTVKVFYGGVELESTDVTLSPQDIVIPVALTHNTTGTFKIEIRDAAGNVATVTNASAVVDVLAPDAPSVTSSIVDARKATVNLSWAPTYDDESIVSSAGNAGYDIRWTYNGILVSNVEKSSMVEADYYDSAKVQTETLVAWNASTINHQLTLPPQSTYYIVVRAKDEVGNYSAFVAPSALANPGDIATLTNPTAPPSGTSAAFGYSIYANGSLNNDSTDDLVVTSYGLNTVYVYYGKSGFSSLSTCAAPDCQTISGASGTTFGIEASVANVGDASGENKPDLIVAAPAWSSARGRVFIYFGTNSAASIDTSTAIEIRGVASGQFGQSARPISDINGDGLDELLISSHGEGGSPAQGKVYIFKGRSLANWQAARVNESGTQVVLTTSADWVIDGPSPVYSGGNQFGREKGGVTNMGDVTGDGVNDFTVPASKNSVNKLYLFSGAAVAAATSNVKALDNPASCPALTVCNFQTLDTGTKALTTRYGFSRRAVGGKNVYGALTNDLVVSHAIDGKVHIFADPTTSFASNPTLTLTGPSSGFFGNSLLVADMNDDSNMDIVVGVDTSSGSTVYIFYNRAGSFDLNYDSGFARSVNRATGTSSIGVSTAVGDFDGDGKPDLAMGDDFSGTGRVLIWHP